MRIGGLLLSLAIGLAPLAASARDAQGEKLGQLVKEGERLYQAGKYREAADALKQAYALDPNPRLLYNIARAYEQAAELREAVDYYQRYVGSKEGTDPTLLKRSALALERLRALIDKEDAARKQQEAAQQKAEAETRAAQERARAEAEAARAAQAEAEARRQADFEAAERSYRRSRMAAFVTGGVAIVGAGAGVLFGLRANSAYSSFKSAQSVSDKDAFATQARTNALIADVGFGVAIAGAATAIILYPKSGEPERKVVLVPALNGVGAVVRF